MNTFRYNGHEFPMFDHPYNATLTNERAVEIPVALDFIAQQEGERGLEVGNVLSNYRCDRLRTVVDRYDFASGVMRCDVFEVDSEYDWIVSISTLEHVRQNEPDDEVDDNDWASLAAMIYLRGLLKPEGRMLVTIGLGQHPTLDRTLVSSSSWLGTRRRSVLIRQRGDSPRDNSWSTLRAEPLPPYGPTHGANAVWIGEWGPT